ncbi:MAG: polyphosphate polymerase domain-containing protein [Gammaproteobacteria bacterium]|nr:polyphosphate polymerase domain-containing protein [Gammaproteobacteria bacterium]
MGKFQQIFQRYELKYILTREKYEWIKQELLKYMKVDKYGISTIQSVYYDTPSYILIRKSLEKPDFKEKLRIRSYGIATEDSPCFLELKRKACGLVYKRRIPVKEGIAREFMNYKGDFEDSQISRELTYFRNYYKDLIPAMLIIYERESFFKENSEVRVTFDFNPRYRTTDLNLHTSLEGTPLLKDDSVLMEIKVLHNMPLWLTDILTRGKIKKGSVSKYGEAYKREKEKRVQYFKDVTKTNNLYQGDL